MRTTLPLLSVLAATAAAFLLPACSSGTSGSSPKPDAAATDATAADTSTNETPDAQPTDAQATETSAATDAEAGLATPVFVAQLDKNAGQLTEGLWEIGPSAALGVGAGTPIVSLVPLAQVASVSADGGTSVFGAASTKAAQSTYALGITTDASGDVYVGVAQAAAPPNNPAPGVYKFPAGGGAGTAFSLGSAVAPAMNFANGLDFIGADLFVADSEGVVYKIDPAGKASVWSDDPLLAPQQSACGGVVPLPIGANGIAHDAHNVYVTNTNYGRLLSIPIQSDGSAGTPAVIKEDCASLVGADGLVIDPKDGSFLVALNIQNGVARVTPAGGVTLLASGPPLATPASLLIDTSGLTRRLLITNAAFFTAADAGSPGLLTLPIP